MNSFEKKIDKFTRRKIQGFGSGNSAGCMKMLQNASKLLQNAWKLFKLLQNCSKIAKNAPKVFQGCFNITS